MSETLDIDADGGESHAARVTLTDLLVSVAVLGVLGAAAFGVVDQGQRAWVYGAARVEAQQSARAALSRLSGEIRVAGAGGTGFDAIAVAEPQRIALQQELNGDGVVTANGERVTWRLDADILRRDAGGGAQPVINGVADFRLRYFDAAGLPTSVPADVRSVEVALTTRASHAPAPAGRPAAATLITRVRLRNR